MGLEVCGMAAGGSLEEIAREIMAGKPDTLTTAGTKFKAVADELTTLAGDIKSAAKGGTGPGVWEGADADAFLSYTDKMSGEITAAVGPLTDDNTAMTDAASALTKAQTDIQDDLRKAKTYRDQTIAAGATPDEAALAAQAEIILDKLKGKYEASTGKMKPLKPMTESGGGGGGGGAGGGGGGGPKKDPKAADPKAADPKAADPKAGDGAQPKPGGPPPATAGGPPPAAGGPPKAPTPVTKAPKIGDSSLVFNTNDPKTKPVSLGNPAKPAVGQPSDTVPLSFMTFAAGGMGSGPPAKPPVVPTKPGLP